VFLQWDSSSRSAPLVQVLMSTACRLLFITVENAWRTVVTVLKNTVCSWEFALSTAITALVVWVEVSVETNRRHYFRSNLNGARDSSTSLVAAQASQKVGHPCLISY